MRQPKALVRWLAVLSMLATTACNAQTQSGQNQTEHEMYFLTPTDDCPVIESGNWIAKLIPASHDGASPILRVRGDLTMPTPGYKVSLKIGKADRSAVPTVFVMLSTIPPDGMVAQVLDSQTVSMTADAPASSLRSVMVICGNTRLFEISDVMMVRDSD
jgi:hypothetical protein